MVEKLETLPQKLSMRVLSGKENFYKKCGHSSYKPTNNIYPYTRVQRLLKKYLGKHVNEAFTHYCKQVPIFQQHYFWEQIKPRFNRRYRYINVYRHFYLDDDFIIREFIPEKKEIYKIASWDIVYGHLNKITGQIVSNEERFKLMWKEGLHYTDFESGHALKGKIYTFLCKNHEFYKRRDIEASKKRKFQREQALIKKNQKYNFKIINLNENININNNVINNNSLSKS